MNLLNGILVTIFCILSLWFEHKNDYQKANNCMLWAILNEVMVLCN